MESNCSKFLDNRRAGRAAGTLESSATVHRDLRRLAIGLGRNLFNDLKLKFISTHHLDNSTDQRPTDEKQLCRKGPRGTGGEAGMPLLQTRPTSSSAASANVRESSAGRL